MTRYYLHLFNPGEATAQIYECGCKNSIDALDDALRAAKVLSSRGDVEVWSDHRRIGLVTKDYQPPGWGEHAADHAPALCSKLPNQSEEAGLPNPRNSYGEGLA